MAPKPKNTRQPASSIPTDPALDAELVNEGRPGKPQPEYRQHPDAPTDDEGNLIDPNPEPARDEFGRPILPGLAR